MDWNRYSRQTILPSFGKDGQAKLFDSRVLCVGAGGLGSSALLHLAAAGVGTIGLIDSDLVEMSNLQRQILFQTADVGQPKVLCGKRRLEALNPDLRVIAYHQRLVAQNALDLFSQYDLILDGSDNFETRFLVNDAAYKSGLPVVYGAVSGFEGQVGLFLGKVGSCYRCFFPRVPHSPIQNCAEAGVLGAAVGAIGTMQAILATQFLVSAGNSEHPLYPAIGQVTIFDFNGSWNIQRIQVPKRSGCLTCSVSPDDVQVKNAPSSCVVETITSKALIQKIESRQSFTLLDVREMDEWSRGHLPGAIHWPMGRIVAGDLPDLKEEVIVYCHSGMRSANAARLLKAAKALAVVSLAGGISEWRGSLDH